MTMTRSNTSSLSIETSEEDDKQADLEAQFFRLLELGRTDPEIAIALKIPIAKVRALRADFAPPKPAAPQVVHLGPAAAQPGTAAPPGVEASRVYCGACGARRSEHTRGEGRCDRTGCPAYEESSA